jgi:hypothetical protein
MVLKKEMMPKTDYFPKQATHQHTGAVPVPVSYASVLPVSYSPAMP